MADDKWRTKICNVCYGGVEFYSTLDGIEERTCWCCGGYGQFFLRPSGHAFAYPGGPALGRWSKEDYEVADLWVGWDND